MFGYGYGPYNGGMPPPPRWPPRPPLVAYESAPMDYYHYADPYAGLVTSLSRRHLFEIIEQLLFIVYTLAQNKGHTFYRAACNADGVLWWEFCPSVCLSVRLSVCPSVTRVYCDKTVERSVQIYIPYERTFSLVFWEQEWLVGDDPFYLKFWVNGPPFEQNRRFSTNNRS